MWMILLIPTFFSYFVVSIQCPTWTCQQPNSTQTGFCYQYDQQHNVIYAEPQCGEEGSYNCYLSDFFDALNSTECQPNRRNLLSQFLENKFCTWVSFSDVIGCEKYCGWVKQTQESEYICNFTNYQNDHPQNKNGTKNFGACREDSECASQKCDCVVNPNDFKGQCTASVYDKYTEDLFQQVCGVEQNQQGKEKRNEDACSLYIFIQMGHFINSVDNYNKQLPCLKQFTDYEWLVNVKNESDKNDKLWLAWFIPVLLVGICCVVLAICGIVKMKKKREAQREGGPINQETKDNTQHNYVASSQPGKNYQPPVPMESSHDQKQEYQPLINPQQKQQAPTHQQMIGSEEQDKTKMSNPGLQQQENKPQKKQEK